MMRMVSRRAMTLLVCLRAISGALLTLPVHLGAQPGGPVAPPEVPRLIYSARDVVGWTLDSELEKLRTPRGVNKTEPAVSTRAQALATARQIAVRRSTAAMRAFLDTSTLSPNQLRKLSVYAAMHGGEGAMASLLAAERRKPGDWATQYNIAMHLLLEGYPGASLAILDSLPAPDGVRGPGGLDLRATLLLGRGNAMLGLGRARAAIPLLREARQREPAMAEAAQSLARAHLMLNEEEEAKRALFLARRFATKAQMDAIVTIIDPKRPLDESATVEAIEDGHALRLNQRWPFRKGYSQALRIMDPPTSPEGIKTFLVALEGEVEKLNGRLLSATSGVQPMALAYATDTISWAFPGLRSQLHADANLPWGTVPAKFAFACAVTEGVSPSGETFDQVAANKAIDEAFDEERLQNPELAGYTRSLRRASAAACTRLAPKFWLETHELLSRRIDRCPSGPGYRPCACQAQRDVAGMQLNAVNEALQSYHTAAKQWYWMAHDQSTSTAGYVEKKDKTLRDMLKAELEVHKAMTAAGVHQKMQVHYQAITSICLPEKPAPTDSTLQEFEPEGFDPVAAACSANDGMGLKYDILVAELKFGCYEIEVEAKTPFPGFKGVGSATYAFGGEKAGNLTFFFGVGVGAHATSNVEVGAKVGAWVSLDDTGTADAGFKASADASAGRVVKEVSTEINGEQVLNLPGQVSYLSNEFLLLIGG